MTTWKDVDLGSQIQRNIEAAKYTKPTPVQRYSLPIVLKGRDLMSCAQTGSGKTAACKSSFFYLLIYC
jgi:ATP-dependent RNA helicase DDX3X